MGHPCTIFRRGTLPCRSEGLFCLRSLTTDPHLYCFVTLPCINHLEPYLIVYPSLVTSVGPPGWYANRPTPPLQPAEGTVRPTGVGRRSRVPRLSCTNVVLPVPETEEVTSHPRSGRRFSAIPQPPVCTRVCTADRVPSTRYVVSLLPKQCVSVLIPS